MPVAQGLRVALALLTMQALAFVPALRAQKPTRIADNSTSFVLQTATIVNGNTGQRWYAQALRYVLVRSLPLQVNCIAFKRQV